jgi:hypothetical protein
MAEQNDNQRLNEVTALADKMVEMTNLMSRQLTRLIDDFEERRDALDSLIDEYDRLMSKWADDDEEAGK